VDAVDRGVGAEGGEDSGVAEVVGADEASSMLNDTRARCRTEFRLHGEKYPIIVED
jgi:hypothetical protein